ncbi:helix-turn-helix domain-containing protein [Streptomyces endophyticus]|uniref:Helix-turn-helix domain-containing protein n=1 Tax=Streptomyces endophyticus TaxID=714166 RepID=A0ABU6EZA0_9ACTN|nr:helix-turn-helix domain-containing protein [Streptomyces endophyticus]MEB8337083.1 helix-turn-helix domain-containing protein [Streptomyces endophyticus]
MAQPRTAGGTRLQSVERALRILTEASRHPEGLTAKRLARFLDVPLATTYHLLRTLAHEGWLEHTEGRYRVGPGAFAFGRTLAGPGEGGDEQGVCRV